MSINWVMLSSSGDFVRLPNEQILHSSPPRVALSLDSLNKYPGQQPFHLSCAAGRVHLTNKRVVYLPTNPSAPPPAPKPTPPTTTASTTTNPLSPQSQPRPSFTSSTSTSTSSQQPDAPPTPTTLTSFTAHHTYLAQATTTSPWFGPNAWTTLVRPTPSGGIPPHLQGVEATFTFKEGGAFDWHARYVEVRERLAQVRDMMREVGEGEGGSGGRGEEGDDRGLEQLPAYSADGGGGVGLTGGPAVNGAWRAVPTQARDAQRGDLIDLNEESEPPAHSAANAEPAATSIPPSVPASTSVEQTGPTTTTTAAQPAARSAPNEAPPGYEESQSAQRDDVTAGLGRMGVGS